MIDPHLGNHSLREPNTCNHRINIQEGSWDSHWALAQHPKLQVFQWLITPHLKVFFLFEWQKQNSSKKSQSFVPEITVLSYSNPEGSSKVLSYQLLFSLRSKCKRSNNESCTQESAKMLPPKQRQEGAILPDTHLPRLTKSCHSRCM